jgi:hypothetical protein
MLKARPRRRLEFAVKCNYLDRDVAAPLYKAYDEIERMIVAMVNTPDSWILPGKTQREET